MGKGSAKQQVDEFYMSIHLGLCGGGPLDAITGLFVGEKLAWEGEATAEGNYFVNQPNLFGGPKDGGGVGGIMYYLPGGPNQVLPEALANRLGLTSATAPGYRGVASVFFIGNDAVPPGAVDTGGSGGSGGANDGYPVGGDGNPGGGGGGGGGRQFEVQQV